MTIARSIQCFQYPVVSIDVVTWDAENCKKSKVIAIGGCRHCGERLIISPVSELLLGRVSPELRHLQVELAAQLPYRQAAALLEELLPKTGGLNYATTRRSQERGALRFQQPPAHPDQSRLTASA